MSRLRLTLRRCALASATTFIAVAARAAAADPPAALPAWPDQQPSVYSQPSRYTQADEPAPPIHDVHSTAAPAAINAVEPANFAATEPAAPFDAPPADDRRHLAPPSEHHLPATAKRDPADAAAAPFRSFGMPLESMYTTGTALAVVLGLFLLFAALVRRGAKKSNSMLPEEVVSVLGRVPLAARQFAELVRVGNKLVLVSVTPTGAEPITEIADPAEIDRLVGLCRQRSKGSSTDEFDQIFRQLADESAPAGFLGEEAPRVDTRLAAGADVFAAYRGTAKRA
jgi:flagellar protein FliO/FliZ